MIILLLLAASSMVFAKQKSDEEVVSEAAKRCTLNQRETKPFHLFAELSPSGPGEDRARTGTVEIWWVSPLQWRREVRSPQFHQIAIVNDDREWQKNEGEYFPHWLEETAIELIEPLPYMDRVLQGVREAEVKHLMGMIHFSWAAGNVAVSEKNGLLLYGGIEGASGEFLNMQPFRGLMVARKVNVGAPQVTAIVKVLEDLPATPAGFFNTSADGGTSQPLHTVLVDGETLKKNVIPGAPVVWPLVKDGPFEGNASATFVLDRTGKVRELSLVVVSNPALREAADAAFAAMRFSPYTENGVPVQALARIELPFKTTRPEGEEKFESAQAYFEKGQRASFPSFGVGKAYVLKAEFQIRRSEGKLDTGIYTDTWLATDKWRREVSLAGSTCVRTRDGDKYYRMSEGKDSGLLNTFLKLLEPIPAIDTFTESDWRIRRDTVEGKSVIRVLRGEEDISQTPQNAISYWFDENGTLLKSYYRLETRWSTFQDFEGVHVAHEARVYAGKSLVSVIRLTQLSVSPETTATSFSLRKHEWRRAFTDEVR